MVAYIRSRTFCCCIPVRFGVFILALLGLVGGSFVSAVGWIQVAQLKQHPLPTVDVIALYLHASVFTLLALLSLFGFVGTLIKQRNFVSAYAIGLMIQLLLSLCIGIYTLYSLFRQNPQDAIAQCLNGATDDLTRNTCTNGLALMKGVAVAIYVVFWLLQIYAYIIVANYVEQLDDEMSAKEAEQMIKYVNRLAPGPMTTYHSFGVPGGQPQNTGYAFSHADQSYGVRGNNSNMV